MSSGKKGFLFPAFGMRYRDFDPGRLPGFEQTRREFMAAAAERVDLDFNLFENSVGRAASPQDVQSDLQAHYVCYINSCTVSRLIQQAGVRPDYVAGYSMGIFAALYHSEALSFEDGLMLMHKTCSYAHEAVDGERYGMGVVVGLTRDEVSSLIDEHCQGLEIADVCSQQVVIASGRRVDLDRLLAAARTAGCIQSKIVPVALPYHSTYMAPAEMRIRDALRDLDVHRPSCGIVSCVDQAVLTSAQAITREAAKNVGHAINWHRTMCKMLDLGVNVFYECGLSEGLCKLMRFLEGDFRAYHPKKLPDLFTAPSPGEPRGRAVQFAAAT